MRRFILRIIRSENIIIKICSGFVILISTFLIIELILWVFIPVSLDQEVKMEMIQDIPGLKKQVLYERNKFGLRSLSMNTIEVPNNTYRIICIGGSTTDQVNQNMEDTWAGKLEIELKKIFEKDVIEIEVALYGRGGETIMDRCVWVSENLLKYNPDLLIIMEGINDLCWHGGVGYKYKKTNRELHAFKEPLTNFAKRSLKKKCLLYSQICRRLKILKYNLQTQYLKKKGKIVEWHTRNLPKLREKYQNLPYVSNPIRKPDPIEEFTDGMFILADFVKGAKIDLLVLGQPVIWNEQMTSEEKDSLWFFVNTKVGPVRPNPIWLVKEIERYNEIQKKIAINFEYDFIDLNERIPKNLLYFFDDCHLTDLGSELVADEILACLEKHIQKYLKNNEVITIDTDTK